MIANITSRKESINLESESVGLILTVGNICYFNFIGIIANVVSL